jgi:hypothetical protein
MVAPVKKRLLTIDEYRRMGEAGIFHEDDRVELIRGEIYELAPITNPPCDMSKETQFGL